MTPKSEAKNRAERRRAAHEKRRKGTRGKFKRTSAAEVIEALKTNIAQWEQTREFHELNIDKDEMLIDAVDPAAGDYDDQVTALEQAIKAEETAIVQITAAIENAELRIKELQAT